MKMYKTILSLIIATFLFISSINANAFTEITMHQHRRIIDGDLDGNEVNAVCTVNRDLSSCQSFNNELECPNILFCLNVLTKYTADNYIVNVLPNVYDMNDCPGEVTSLPSGLVIISSSLGQSLFNCNGKQFLNINFENTTELVLDGLDITNGKSSGGGCLNIQSTVPGSSFYMYNSSATNCVSVNSGGFLSTTVDIVFTSNCTFTDNVSQKGEGGVIMSNLGDVILYNSTFIRNSGTAGGVANGVNIFAMNSLFFDNVGTLYGGCFNTILSLYINASNFAGNTAGQSGGVAFGEEGPVFINMSVFTNNSSPVGGVIQCSQIVMIGYSEFYNNSAVSSGSGAGGAIYISTYYRNVANLTLINCTFEDNYSDLGGAIYADTVSLNITNSTFFYNTANVGGGALYIINGQYLEQYVNITFSNFFGCESYENGGAIYLSQYFNQSVYLNVTGTIFVNNLATQYAGAIYFIEPPTTFVGGEFIGSKSSEQSSMTFYSYSIQSENIVSVILDLPLYNVPIFDESNFQYWKALGVQGNCKNGVATINEEGVVLTCRSIRHRKLHIL